MDMFSPVYAWLIVALILLLLEIGTPGLFFFISFSIGACGAAASASLGHTLETQCISGFMFALAAFFILKASVTIKKRHGLKTNVDALIGQEAIVTTPIENKKPGAVKIRGEEWPAIIKEGPTLQRGTAVKIISIQGNKLIVSA